MHPRVPLLLIFIPFFFLFSVVLWSEALCQIDHAQVSIYAVQADSGAVLIDQNSDSSLIPASCLKIITTAAALHLLGAETRFETKLEYDGWIDPHRNILHGNLYIRGGGDPCLGSDRISPSLSWKKQLSSWVDALNAAGIQTIEGTLFSDSSLWEKALAVPCWAWEDLGNYYGAGACALSFHENTYSLFFKPGSKVGEKALLLRTDPPTTSLSLQNEVKTGPEGSGDCASIFGSEFSSLRSIRGTIPAGTKEFVIRGSIPNPPSFCVDLLHRELLEKGVMVQNKKIFPQKKRLLLHITYSPPISEIVYWTNQKSINLYAEHLLKKIGEVVYHEGSSVAGSQAVVDFWKSQGIDWSGCNMADGSGLSRKNLVTTKQLVQILVRMKQSTLFPLFFDSLPKQEGPMRAKSGSMSLIKGYVGYTGTIAFAILVNQCSDPQLMDEKIRLALTYLNTL